MHDSYETELRIAVAEGLITREDAEAVEGEARRKQLSPLALLVEQGRLSEDSCRSLLANTVTFGDTARPPAGVPAGPAFPAAAWDRYVSVRFLGQGGMGQVFLAQDPRLQRDVAIKFVLRNAPEDVRRLITEARAQARVSHECVCKIHEVGEVDGKVYIAMQYIDGAPLGSIAGELTVEQKVMLIRGAAEGLHAAHRAGIIHRDVKPSNIMVERTGDGALRPYVMDFGLARAASDDGLTLTGTILGTPRYMAPEQARGHAATLDRRADVYSLGATLYELLTGQPSTPGENVMEVLHNLETTEPRPPRALDPDIPVDLEAIVLKCLEHNRSARYDSARALADDLGRFLNGEPVIARAAGAWYRLRKRLVKHRRLIGAGAVAIAGLLVAVGWGLQTRHEANERERLARRFTEKVERIDQIARYSALSPAHDIRGDQAVIRAKLAELEREIRGAGAVAVGPGHYALGRGYLALDDDARAREQLELAWRDDFREPRVAYALALVMGRLYRQQQLAVERLESKDQREAKQRALEHQYRDPALGYLAASAGAEVPSTEYVAALAAFYEGHLDAALQHLDAIRGGLAWFYEAPELRGDILFARATKLSNQGERDRARLDFEAGRRAYAAAGAIGESVPAVYESLGELEYAAMQMELYGEGDVLPAFHRAIAATTRALAIMPEHYDALVLEARTHRRLAEYQANRGSDVEDQLAKAVAATRRAVVVSPTRPEARLETAQIYRQWGKARCIHNQDPSELLRKAVEASVGIPAEYRDALYYINLGLIFKVWADYEDLVGVDAQLNRGKAIEAYSRAIQINDKLGNAWINLGTNYLGRASQPGAKDPGGDLTQAVRAFDKARSINPSELLLYYYEGQSYDLVAKRERAHGRDPGPALVRSLAAYQAGLAVNPRYQYFHNGIGIVLLGQANEAWDRGAAPDALLDQAQAAFAQAIAVAPDQGYGYGNVGAVHAQRAWFQRARGQDPSVSVQAAVESLNQAIARIPDYAGFWADLGKVHAIAAEYDLEQGRDPRPSLAQAASAIRKALDRNPKDAQSELYLGETRTTWARLHASQGHGRGEDFEQAAEAFQRASDLEPENPRSQVAIGHFYRRWAVFQRDAGRAPSSSLTRGLDLVDHVLAARPNLPDARILRASLLLLQAQSTAPGAERRDQASRAAREFSSALAKNPGLDNAWRIQAALAQHIAGAPDDPAPSPTAWQRASRGEASAGSRLP